MNETQKTWYESAVRMYDREHDRWNSWALFFFGSIVSVFVIWHEMGEVFPLWAPAFTSALLSAMWVAAALNIRATTWAWWETVLHFEMPLDEGETPFAYFELRRRQRNRLKDLRASLKLWRAEPWQSLTMLLIACGAISTVLFCTIGVASIFGCFPSAPVAKLQ